MAYVTLIFLCTIIYFVIYANCNVVSFIDPCKADDKACILASSIKALPYVANGIAELGVQPSDPFVVKTVQALDGDLKLELNDIAVTGIKDCKILNVEREAAEGLIKLVSECPFVATGTYEVSGKMIFLPIEGNGPFSINSERIKVLITTKVDTVDRDGKNYWSIVHRNIDFEPIEKVFIKFENLFNGDKEKAEPIQKLFDQNWYDLVTTLGKPLFQQIISKEIDNINTFFNNVPLNELEIA